MDERVPECCVLGEGPSLAERLYVLYCSGFAARMGLDPHGNLLPSWALLQREKAVGLPTSTQEVARWEAVAEYVGTVMVHLGMWATNPVLQVKLPCDGMNLRHPVSLQTLFRQALVLREGELGELVEFTAPDRELTVLGKQLCGWAVQPNGAPGHLGTIYVLPEKAP